MPHGHSSSETQILHNTYTTNSSDHLLCAPHQRNLYPRTLSHCTQSLIPQPPHHTRGPSHFLGSPLPKSSASLPLSQSFGLWIPG